MTTLEELYFEMTNNFILLHDEVYRVYFAVHIIIIIIILFVTHSSFRRISACQYMFYRLNMKY